ncbi:MAG: hypothetical protein IPK32_07220 [Verrucomicrobiaceae bacterium]|nr:hypothetical protein [Verrucomicrobiaceae bacterium]
MLFGLWEVLIEDVRKWVKEKWYQIAHNGDKHLGEAGTQVDRIKSIGGAMNYFAKYMSKGDQTRPGNFTGRYWGKINAEMLPVPEAVSLPLDGKKAFQIRRIARRKMEDDVNRGFWRRFLESMDGETPNKVIGSRLGWEQGLAQLREGKEKLVWWRWNRGGVVDDEEFSFYVEPHLDQWICYKEFLMNRRSSMPKRWKARNNDRVRLLCDASAFVEAISRLDAPASSFAQWSRQKDA